MGADVVIAVDVSSDVEPFEDKSGLDIVMRADAVSRICLNEIMVKAADVVIHPDVGSTHWADFSDPMSLVRMGETAAREKLMAIRTIMHRPQIPQKTIVDQIRSIKDKIIEKVTGPK
jgi:hypothetical protein